MRVGLWNSIITFNLQWKATCENTWNLQEFIDQIEAHISKKKPHFGHKYLKSVNKKDIYGK